MKKAGSLPRELFPLKSPFMVVHAWSITACCAFLFFPLLFPVAYLVHWIKEASLYLFGVPFQVPPAISLVGAIMLAIYPPLYVAFSKTSRYILATVRLHLDAGDSDKAIKAALAVDYQFWYREYKKNPWFRNFVQENKLTDRSPRYLKLAGKFERRN